MGNTQSHLDSGPIRVEKSFETIQSKIQLDHLRAAGAQLRPIGASQGLSGLVLLGKNVVGISRFRGKGGFQAFWLICNYSIG